MRYSTVLLGIAQYDPAALGRPAWNVRRTVGVKKPLKQQQIWAIRFFLDRAGRLRGRALFDLAIDSKLRGCDLVKIKIGALITRRPPLKRGRAYRQERLCALVSAKEAIFASAREQTLATT